MNYRFLNIINKLAETEELLQADILMHFVLYWLSSQKAQVC